MIGDKLVITDYHRQGAAQAWETLQGKLAAASGVLAVSVAGESGSGKSEIAFCLKELVEKQGKKAVIFGQDDYFKLPPKSNHNKRLEDISWVGPGEVKLDLLDEHIAAIKQNPDKPLEKPLVYYDEDRIDTETLQPASPQVVIAEGTYTSLLENLDMRVFINRNYRQTKKARLKRARDPDVAFLEKVLEIEHQEISRHKARADVVLAPPPEEQDMA
jgi:uridine kinase